MSIFGKIKSAVNYITGGGASLEIEILEETPILGVAFQVKVTGKIGDQNINSREIYVEVKAEESVSIEVDSDSSRQTVNRKIETYSQKFNLSGPEELQANQTYTWYGGIMIDENQNGTYKGTNAKHIWKICAGIDCSGNDPDSGWKKFEIY